MRDYLVTLTYECEGPDDLYEAKALIGGRREEFGGRFLGVQYARHSRRHSAATEGG